MTRATSDPVLILTGAPGAGKTAVARLLASRSERAAHVESDSFFHFIQSGYIEPWKPESHEQNTVVMRIVAEAADLVGADASLGVAAQTRNDLAGLVEHGDLSPQLADDRVITVEHDAVGVRSG